MDREKRRELYQASAATAEAQTLELQFQFGNGWIYDPKVGKSYNVEISLAKQDTLHVYGYLGMKLMGRSIYWKRAPENLPRCDNETSAQKASQ